MKIFFGGANGNFGGGKCSFAIAFTIGFFFWQEFSGGKCPFCPLGILPLALIICVIWTWGGVSYQGISEPKEIENGI